MYLVPHSTFFQGEVGVNAQIKRATKRNKLLEQVIWTVICQTIVSSKLTKSS